MMTDASFKLQETFTSCIEVKQIRTSIGQDFDLCNESSCNLVFVVAVQALTSWKFPTSHRHCWKQTSVHILSKKNAPSSSKKRLRLYDSFGHCNYSSRKFRKRSCTLPVMITVQNDWKVRSENSRKPWCPHMEINTQSTKVAVDQTLDKQFYDNMRPEPILKSIGEEHPVSDYQQ